VDLASFLLLAGAGWGRAAAPAVVQTTESCIIFLLTMMIFAAIFILKTKYYKGNNLPQREAESRPRIYFTAASSFNLFQQ
jgi:hypothetical protein